MPLNGRCWWIIWSPHLEPTTSQFWACLFCRSRQINEFHERQMTLCAGCFRRSGLRVPGGWSIEEDAGHHQLASGAATHNRAVLWPNRAVGTQATRHKECAAVMTTYPTFSITNLFFSLFLSMARPDHGVTVNTCPACSSTPQISHIWKLFIGSCHSFTAQNMTQQPRLIPVSIFTDERRN